MPFGPSSQHGQPQTSLSQPPPNFLPTPFQSQTPFVSQPFQPQPLPGGPAQFHGAPLSGPPRSFGVTSPVQAFHQQQAPPRTHTPPLNAGLPPRSGHGSLPAAPGLPQRPVFGAPQVNAFQMQQMHQGQIPGLPNPPPNLSVPLPSLPQNLQQNGFQQQSLTSAVASATPGDATKATSTDDVMSAASKEADTAALAPKGTPSAPTPVHTAAPPATEGAGEKTSKKDKDKSKMSKMVYTDNEVSPEEKMARMPRYAYTPQKEAAMV